MGRKLIISGLITMSIVFYISLLVQSNDIRKVMNKYDKQIQEIKEVANETKIYNDAYTEITQLQTENETLLTSITKLNTDIATSKTNAEKYKSSTEYYNS